MRGVERTEVINALGAERVNVPWKRVAPGKVGNTKNAWSNGKGCGFVGKRNSNKETLLNLLDLELGNAGVA